LLLNAVQGVHDEIERLRPADTSDLADARVRERVDRLRRIRFFRSADSQAEVARLADAVLTGQLRGATIPAKIEALAWCARIAAFVDLPLAESWLEAAEALGDHGGELLTVAKAFIRG